jgi:hypothetical protein
MSPTRVVPSLTGLAELTLVSKSQNLPLPSNPHSSHNSYKTLNEHNDNSCPASFTYFGSLPIELQNMVWKLAVQNREGLFVSLEYEKLEFKDEVDDQEYPNDSDIEQEEKGEEGEEGEQGEQDKVQFLS